MFLEVTIEIILTIILSAVTIFLFTMVPTDTNKVAFRIVGIAACVVTLIEMFCVILDFKELYEKYFT